MTKYIPIEPGGVLPDINALKPFCAIVVIESDVATDWQNNVSRWLVESGCLFMVAWGKDCSTWDDSVDKANRDMWDGDDIPDEAFVMTTWHEDKSLKEAFWFAKHCAFHECWELTNTLILDINPASREKELITQYRDA